MPRKGDFKDLIFEPINPDNPDDVAAYFNLTGTDGATKLEMVKMELQNAISQAGNYMNAAELNQIKNDIWTAYYNLAQLLLKASFNDYFITSGDENAEMFGINGDASVLLNQRFDLFLSLVDDVVAGATSLNVYASGGFRFAYSFAYTPIPSTQNGGYLEKTMRLFYDEYRKLILISFESRYYNYRFWRLIDEQGAVQGLNQSRAGGGNNPNVNMTPYNNFMFLSSYILDGTSPGWTVGILYNYRPLNTMQSLSFYYNGDYIAPAHNIRHYLDSVVDSINNRLLVFGIAFNPVGYLRIASSPLPQTESDSIALTALSMSTNIQVRAGANVQKHPVNAYYVLAAVGRLWFSANLTSWSGCTTSGLTTTAQCLRLCVKQGSPTVWVFINNGNLFYQSGDTLTTTSANVNSTPTGFITAGTVTDLCLVNGVFYFCTSNGEIGYSSNGINWTQIEHNLGTLNIQAITVTQSGKLYAWANNVMYVFEQFDPIGMINKRMSLDSEIVMISSITEGSGGASIVTLTEPLSNSHSAGTNIIRTDNTTIRPQAINQNITFEVNNIFPHNEVTAVVLYDNLPDVEVTALIAMKETDDEIEVFQELELQRSETPRGKLENTYYHVQAQYKNKFVLAFNVTNPTDQEIELTQLFGFVANEIAE